MTISVMLITHEEVGHAFINTVSKTFGGGDLPLPTTVVSIDEDTDPELIMPRLQRAAEQIEDGQGLLILTDLFGSTPCNIATELGQQQRVRVVTGLNLPMLMRLMNYADLDLDELAEKAASGGKDGVIQCECVETQAC